MTHNKQSAQSIPLARGQGSGRKVPVNIKKYTQTDQIVQKKCVFSLKMNKKA
jgi:hypothetical protein